MGSDDVSTGLVLGLSHHSKTKKSLISCRLKKKNPSSNYGSAFLTIGFYDETSPMATNSRVHKQLPDGPNDALRRQGSASNSSSFKQDRDFCDGDEVEAEELEEDVAGSPRKKLRLTKDQSAFLEYSFKEHATLNPKQKQELARRLSLSTRQVEVWFQNRRARTKLKQTEESCELLKKCCESLTEENTRLRKEIQDLRSIKATAHPPFYMQLQTATLSLCVLLCERICSTGDGSGSSPTSTLSVDPNLTFVIPFNQTRHYFPALEESLLLIIISQLLRDPV